MSIFGVLLAFLFPGPFPRPVFGLVRSCRGAVSAVVRSRGQRSGALGEGGDSFGDPFTGLSEGNSIRLAASFGTGAADLRASPPAAGPPLQG